MSASTVGDADTAEGRRADLVNPSTGEVFASAPISGAEDVDRAYRTAADAFEGWRESTPADRQAVKPATVWIWWAWPISARRPAFDPYVCANWSRWAWVL